MEEACYPESRPAWMSAAPCCGRSATNMRSGAASIASPTSAWAPNRAGMSAAETERAVALIRKVSQGRTLIEHDMGVVFDLADRISVLVYGQIIASDSPGRIKQDAAVQTAYLGTAA